ncbi:adenylyltransferase/cytidyltransferase family protein [Vibrio owensii]|uniref:adenylyltransferase/cytidyltransferase family protein n=1 Tax=Vibrio owensii TaxID=696485 RepID=UPI002895020B|nr:Adenylyltransferase/cytidyltransferase family protein [Vibrio owensii]
MKKNKIRVYTSGTWDLFHVGHINILKESMKYGDELIVGVSTDELVESYKGTKPIIPFEERLQIIESVKGVTKAVKQTVLTEVAQLEALNIDVVTIGDDWKELYLEGLDWMEKQEGKQVAYLPYTKGVSTTSIKKKIISNIYEIIAADFKREENNIVKFKTGK